MQQLIKNNQGPTDATIAVTHKCNSKCIMCNIWKDTSKDALAPEDFLKLPKTLKDVNITGGEAFLRNDLVEIAKNLTQLNPNMRMVFSSNGFLTDRIVDFMCQIRKFNPKACISISLDGIGEMHSETRGINDAYDKVLKTIEGLKKANINDIRVGYTGSDKNISHLSQVYDFAKANNIEFTMSIVHNSENYFNIDTNTLKDIDSLENQLNYVIRQELKQINPRRLFRTYYFKGIINYAKTDKRLLPCCALKNSFFINALGKIFPCNILETSIGNLKEDNFENIWTSRQNDNLRKYCESCNKCWMVCTVKNSMRKEPVKVVKSVILEKLKNL